MFFTKTKLYTNYFINKLKNKCYRRANIDRIPAMLHCRELATANFTSPGYTSESVVKLKPKKPFGSCSILVTKIFPGLLESLVIRTDMKTEGAKLLGSMTSLLLGYL